MEAKIRVYNDRKYPIGLILPNGLERVVHAQSYTLLSREEIEYAASNAPRLFEGERQLRLEDRGLSQQMGFIESAEQPVLDDAEIRKKLNLRASQMKGWLDSVTEGYLLDAIFDVAMAMDLPASKLQILRERMPDKEWLEPDKESAAE